MGKLKLLKKARPVLEALANERPAVSSLEKLFRRRKPFKNNPALRDLLSAGLELGQDLYARPGYQATLDSFLSSLLGGGSEDEPYPHDAVEHAEAIVEALRDHGITALRVAVDGVPGSGKTTLARFLAERLELPLRTLDYSNMDKPIDFSAPAVYEHHRLLRTQNLDAFDVIVYIDEPVEISKRKVLRRRRGGYLIELMDYECLKRVGSYAFAAASSAPSRANGSYILFKLRPAGGFRIRENIDAALRAQGVRTESLSQEQLLFLASEQRHSAGFMAYVDGRPFRAWVVSTALRMLGQVIKRA